ncbi:MAG: hypothetical protein KGI52_01880 [Burkholderiales bacterium]|nr:hypothetical protein [Burkholderiales bacterium]
MNVAKLLQLAGVPPTLWPEAQACLDRALETTGGTLAAILSLSASDLDQLFTYAVTVQV